MSDSHSKYHTPEPVSELHMNTYDCAWTYLNSASIRTTGFSQFKITRVLYVGACVTVPCLSGQYLAGSAKYQQSNTE